MKSGNLLMVVLCAFALRAPAQLVADFSASATVLDCNTRCVDFTDLTTGGTPVSWQWSFPGAVPANSTAPNPTNICYPNDGLFDVTLIVSDGLTTDTLSQPAFILAQSLPGAFVSPDTTILFGGAVLLSAGGGTSYSWNPPVGLDDPTSQTPIASPAYTTLYVVTITDATSGCSTDLSVTVTVEKEDNLFVPSAFSPNSDGYNDMLYLRGSNFSSVKFSIFDRWGTKVFETTNPDKGWDGTYKSKKVPAGVYTYVAEIIFDGGTPVTLKGKTSLIR
jgi:gliding motility-associated-like protein